MSLASRMYDLAVAVATDFKDLTTGKVSVVAGKGLSANDYTTTEKTKLAAVKLPGFETQSTIAAATGSVNLDLSVATIFQLTLTGNTTITFSNVPAPAPNQAYQFTVRLISGAVKYTITWPSGLTWLNIGSSSYGDTAAPTKMVEYVISTVDGVTAIARKGASN